MARSHCDTDFRQRTIGWTALFAREKPRELFRIGLENVPSFPQAGVSLADRHRTPCPERPPCGRHRDIELFRRAIGSSREYLPVRGIDHLDLCVAGRQRAVDEHRISGLEIHDGLSCDPIDSG